MARYGNVHHGGRPKGVATIEREKVKDYIAQQIALNIVPIVKALVKKSKKADTFAVRELFDRGFGKPTTMIGGDKSDPLIIQISRTIANKNDINSSTG